MGINQRFNDGLNDDFPTAELQEWGAVIFPRYIKVLTLPEFNGKISEIRIEGYASLEAGENRNSDSDYLRNMELTQSRARNVLQYVFGIPALADKKEWLRENVITNGYSFGKAGGSGEEERRVEFSFVTTAEHETVSTFEFDS